ncbi:Aldehyde oxidoreductase FAD-binding subunit PaoB [subsurface metagenome]
MNDFTIVNATTVSEAASALGQPKSAVLAGGTDLLGQLKSFMSPNNAPDTLVNIKTISGLDSIKEEGGMLKIGALVKLADIAASATVKANYAALAEAARKVATPELRNMGTIGGNICQQVRCWYYRAEFNAFNCLRKNPAGVCQALIGDNRYHSIFGAMNGCIAVNPSDTAPALIAFDAKIVTSKNSAGYSAEDFFTFTGAGSEKTTVLDDDEIVTEIQVPTPAAGTKSVFLKFAIRKAFDFPIVNCAVVRSSSEVRICLNGVGPAPVSGVSPTPIPSPSDIAEDLLADAIPASPVGHNKYMIQIAKTLVKRAVEATA